MDERIARPITRLVLALAVLAIAAAGCGGGDATSGEGPTSPPAATEPVDEPTDAAAGDAAEEPADDPADGAEGPAAPAAPAGNTTTPPATDSEDGTHPARIVEAEADTLTVDRIEILSGDAAAAARAEDGEPPVEPGVDVPYLRNRNPGLRALPVADDVRVRVYDCSAACALAPWTYADLVAGTPLPYGSPDAPFEVTVRGGQVVEIAEVYLP